MLISVDTTADADDAFDEMVENRGYASRSEAISKMISDSTTSEPVYRSIVEAAGGAGGVHGDAELENIGLLLVRAPRGNHH